jgi:hypothetical protein
MLTHKDCGGKVIEDPSGDGYSFTGEDAELFGEFVPAYVCDKCGEEIVSDSSVVIEDGLPK